MGGVTVRLIDGPDGPTLEAGGIAWAALDLPLLNGERPAVHTAVVASGSTLPADGEWLHVRLSWTCNESVEQDELALRLRLLFDPTFWWAPHLAPADGDCIAQHVFRAPALIASATTAGRVATLVVIPDLDLCGAQPETPWFLDLDAPARTFWLGMSRSELTDHVRYRKSGGMVFSPEQNGGRIELGFFVSLDASPAGDPEGPANPFRAARRFLWQRYARPLFDRGRPTPGLLEPYVDHTYRWAFESWNDSVWQEFELGGTRVGGPAFIVNVTQSPNYPGEPSLREVLSVWNQAWFSSLRTAAGLHRYARRTGDDGLLQKALMTKEFALAAPMRDGIFPSVYRTEMTEVEVDGKVLRRSLGWETGYWTNSDRTPTEHGIDARWFHVVDSSWTALQMVRWYTELELDDRLRAYVQAYAWKLLTLQDGDGFFPAWLHPETLEPSEVLRVSPETSVSAAFFLALSKLTNDGRYQDAALRALDVVVDEIVATGRWEDFETYWSCCPFGKEEHYGRKFERNGMYKQCNLSMFWTAEALLAGFEASGDVRYLQWGRRTLDELAMTQQVWEPPFIYTPAVGGFGVMNFDGEWNDARQSLFAELFLDYYRVTGETELFERGVAALRASFIMMYCPENPVVKALWERRWPFFGPEDYGFMMENYGHPGVTTPDGVGVGRFSIYDWGSGTAAAAFARIREHYGDVYVDAARGRAFAVNGLAVSTDAGQSAYTIQNPGSTDRNVRLVRSTGEAHEFNIAPGGSVTGSFGRP